MQVKHRTALNPEEALVRLLRPSLSQGAPEPLPPDSWDGVIDAARVHGVAALLYSCLKANGQLAQAPEAAVQALRGEWFRCKLANDFWLEELERLANAFQEADLPFVVLKGGHLAFTLYPDSGQRPLTDLDLWVIPAQSESAKALLLRQGYVRAQEMTDGFGDRFLGEAAFVRRGPHPSTVDLHWHLYSIPYYRRHVALEWFWERTVPYPTGSTLSRGLAPGELAAYLAAHWVLHHPHGRLIWSYDLALVLARHGAEINWLELIHAMQGLHLNLPLRMALERTEKIWGVGAPPEALAALEAYRPTLGERAAFVAATSRLRDARIFWDWVYLPGDRWNFGRQLLFPDAAYMERRYGPAPGRWVPLLYLRRFGEGIFKVGQSVFAMALRTTRGRE